MMLQSKSLGPAATATRAGDETDLRDLGKQFAAYHGVRHCWATSSVELAFRALYSDLDPGDEVLCPVYTHSSTVTALLQSGIKPTLVDCDEGGRICSKDLAARVSPRTKAIVVAHVWGQACEMNKIESIAITHGLALLEDGSHALGATFGGRPVGSFGQAAAFRFADRAMPTGDAVGVFLTNDDGVFERALSVTSDGGATWADDPFVRFAAVADFESLGTTLAARRTVAAYVASKIADHPLVELVFPRSPRSCSWGVLMFSLSGTRRTEEDLEWLVAQLRERGCAHVEIPRWVRPLNLLSHVQSLGYAPGQFLRAERFYRSTFMIPNWDNFEVFRNSIDAFVDALNSIREVLR